jgi:UDP-N-acetyl-D-mannosaminuronic acid dehydrogenase
LSLKEAITKIRNRTANLAVLGSGTVGLPTAAIFANAGFNVVAVDIKREVVEGINKGKSKLNERDIDRLVKRNVEAGRLRATQNSFQALSRADIIIISVQTPIDKNKNPNLSFLLNALNSIGKILKNKLVIVSSTIPPGTMLQTVKPLLESRTGLKADEDFFLAYVPERIAPRNTLNEFTKNPRLVGGISINSTKIAVELFRTVCQTVIKTDASTAEVAKLAENTFRDVNIAFANQLALICEQYGVDATEVIKLANTHPRVNIHKPGPGVGGPCVPKDPYLLTHQCKHMANDVIKTARQINDYMPKHIVDLILQAMKDTSKEVKESRIAILGTAYKGDVDDSRLSPSEPIIHELRHLGAQVSIYDPHCNESFYAKREKNLHQTIKGADCLVVITDHKEFKKLKLKEIKKLMNNSPHIIDGRRMINPYKAEELGFIYHGVGFGKTNKQ